MADDTPISVSSVCFGGVCIDPPGRTRSAAAWRGAGRRRLVRDRSGRAVRIRCPARRVERRLQEAVDPVVAAERVRHADVAGEHRAERQDDQRDGHRRRRVVQVPAVPMVVVAVAAVRAVAVRVVTMPRRGALAVEGQEHQAEHVDRGQQRRHRADRPTARVCPVEKVW